MNLFKIHSSKGIRELNIPISWETLSTGQFINMATDWDGEDLVKLFSILSGIEYKTLEKTHDFILEEQLLNATKFVYDSPMDFKDAPPPHWVEVGKKKIRIPVKVGSLSIGQSIHVRKAMDKCIADKVGYDRLIAFIVAIYLQPFYELSQEELDKQPAFEGLSFDFHNAMLLEEEVLKMPITKTFPLAAFFLRKLTKPGQSIMQRLNFLITRLRHSLNQNDKGLQYKQE